MECGIPYGLSIKSKKDELIRAWKLAHSLLAMGTTMLAVGAIISHLKMGSCTCHTTVTSWITCGYMGFHWHYRWQH